MYNGGEGFSTDENTRKIEEARENRFLDSLIVLDDKGRRKAIGDGHPDIIYPGFVDEQPDSVYRVKMQPASTTSGYVYGPYRRLYFSEKEYQSYQGGRKCGACGGRKDQDVRWSGLE